MGLLNSTVLFGRAVKKVMSTPCQILGYKPFVDDMNGKTLGFYRAVREISRLLWRLIKFNLRIHPKKTELFQESIPALGMKVSNEGIELLDEMVR